MEPRLGSELPCAFAWSSKISSHSPSVSESKRSCAGTGQLNIGLWRDRKGELTLHLLIIFSERPSFRLISLMLVLVGESTAALLTAVQMTCCTCLIFSG